MTAIEHCDENVRERPIRVVGQNNIISLAVIETSNMSCELLKFALEASQYKIRVCATATHEPHAVDRILKNNPDVVLISATPNGGAMSGFEILRKFHIAQKSLRAVMLLESAENQLVLETFRLGAKGVCARTDSFEALCKCIYCVHLGQIWASSEQLQYVLTELDRALPHSVVDVKGNALLTTREEEIVRLVSHGLRNHDIAEQLHLSEHTVKNHIFRIFEKLGVSSRGELILNVLNQQR